jgi:hypothetical protein
MTIFAVVLFLLSLLLTWYALCGRAWLKAKTWAKPFFDWIEPIEVVLYKKSETILFARMKMATGLLLSVLTSMGEIDLTPIMPFVPEKYQGWLHAAFNLAPLMLSVVGWMDERLRNRTTKPVEIVAIPDAKLTPEAARAIDAADAAKDQAVAAVEQAKAA